MAFLDKTGLEHLWAHIVSNVEKISNKVTSISDQSTDAQYPSAKAVYSEISKINSGGLTYNVTEVSITIALNASKAEVQYTPVYDNGFIVINTTSCCNVEGPEAYARDVCIEVLPVYTNYQLDATKKRIVAYRNDTSTAPINITVKVIEVKL